MQEKKSPIFIKKVFTFLIALLIHIFTGAKTVSMQTYKERTDTCFKCPLLIEEKGKPTCSVCGCKVLKKAKWADQDCPENYWNKTND